MSSVQRRLYGRNWDDAPEPLRRVVTAILVGIPLQVPIGIAAVILESYSAGLTVAVCLFVVGLVALVIGLSVFLLRRSRVMWLILVASFVQGLLVVPDSLWEFPGYAVSLVTLVLLLAPGCVRAVWSGRQVHAATPDFRRAD